MVKVGQLRALGERSPDGLRFTPEKVVTGSFRTVAGTVSTVDAATGEIKVSDLQTKQPLTVVIKQDAVLRKFPPAGEMAMFGRGPGAGQAPPPDRAELHSKVRVALGRNHGLWAPGPSGWSGSVGGY